MLRSLPGYLIAAVAALAQPSLCMAQQQKEAIRFDIPVLPDLQRYADLLAQPGYLAIVLENNGLSPSQSSKLKIGEQGRTAEIRGATFRFTGKTGAVYSYEAGYSLGLGGSKLSFPVTVDASGIPYGKVLVAVSPPLMSLIPDELTDRIRLKSQLIASLTAQKKVLAYLDAIPKEGNLVEAILVDAFNRGGGPMAESGRDVGDAVPLSDQWLLILTLFIWLIVVPAYLFVHRRRHRRSEPA